MDRAAWMVWEHPLIYAGRIIYPFRNRLEPGAALL